jgi:hypothetical protein
MPDLSPTGGAAAKPASVKRALTDTTAAPATAVPATPFALTTPTRTMYDDLFNSVS